MENIIEVDKLTKTYKTYHRGSGTGEALKSFFVREKVLIDAVKDVSFAVKKGSITGILGPNGAGKSTTIKMLIGALYPTAGSIKVMGYSPAKQRAQYVKHIGAVFGQKSQLIWDIPPVDSFRMNKAIYGVPNPEYQERLKLLTELFEVTNVMEKPTRVLSLGERMKCEFIMAMLHEPEIVFLDEPTIGLDVIAKQKIRDFIKEMNARGTTFILTTHDLDDVEQLAEQIVIINHGVKVFDDSLDKLQTELGAKKLIELQLTKAYVPHEHEGINIQSVGNDGKVILELDTEKMPVAMFMKLIADENPFSDISVKALPMETIITSIYKQ